MLALSLGLQAHPALLTPLSAIHRCAPPLALHYDGEQNNDDEVFVLSFRPGAQDEGVYTVQGSSATSFVLAFEENHDADHFARLLNAQGFGVAPLSWSANDLVSFCDGAGYEVTLVPGGTQIEPPPKHGPSINFENENGAPSASTSGRFDFPGKAPEDPKGMDGHKPFKWPSNHMSVPLADQRTPSPSPPHPPPVDSPPSAASFILDEDLVRSLRSKLETQLREADLAIGSSIGQDTPNHIRVPVSPSEAVPECALPPRGAVALKRRGPKAIGSSFGLYSQDTPNHIRVPPVMR